MLVPAATCARGGKGSFWHSPIDAFPRVPVGQSQVNEPSVFVHTPWHGYCLRSRHSSISAIEHPVIKHNMYMSKSMPKDHIYNFYLVYIHKQCVLCTHPFLPRTFCLFFLKLSCLSRATTTNTRALTTKTKTVATLSASELKLHV